MIFCLRAMIFALNAPVHIRGFIFCHREIRREFSREFSCDFSVEFSSFKIST
jgi:hypothetical protein